MWICPLGLSVFKTSVLVIDTGAFFNQEILLLEKSRSYDGFPGSVLEIKRF